MKLAEGWLGSDTSLSMNVPKCTISVDISSTGSPSAARLVLPETSAGATGWRFSLSTGGVAVVIFIQQRRQAATHLPFQIIGQYAKRSHDRAPGIHGRFGPA